jgi:N-acetylmuramic acid 6-phosphate (MurNAc-6-P) etherase
VKDCDTYLPSDEEVVAMIQQGQEAQKNREPSAEDKKKLAEANLADVRAKQIQAEVAGEDAESQLDFMSMAAGDPKVYS